MVLHFTQIGSSTNEPPIYLIHTVPLDSQYFVRSLEGMNLKVQCIAIDLPSHGQSDDVDEEKLSFGLMADRIDGLRQKLGHQKIYLLGHGVGGFVAQEYAIKYEATLAGLFLVNTAPNTKYREIMAWNIREKYSKVTIQALEQYQGDTSDKSLKVRFTQSLATYFDPVNHEYAKSLLDNAHRVATEAYVKISRDLIPKVDFRPKIRSLQVPVYVIACTHDVWPETSSQLIRNDIIHARYKELPTGHFPMVSEPKLFWDTVVSFIS